MSWRHLKLFRGGTCSFFTFLKYVNVIMSWRLLQLFIGVTCSFYMFLKHVFVIVSWRHSKYFRGGTYNFCMFLKHVIVIMTWRYSKLFQAEHAASYVPQTCECYYVMAAFTCSVCSLTFLCYYDMQLLYVP